MWKYVLATFFFFSLTSCGGTYKNEIYWTVNGSEPCRDEDGYHRCADLSSPRTNICVQRYYAEIYCKGNPRLPCLDDEVEVASSRCVRMSEVTRFGKPWGNRYRKESTTRHSCDEKKEFLCKQNGNCIPRHLVMNGKDDCENGTDEIQPLSYCYDETEFMCPTTGKCILRQYVNDNFTDCRGGEDENIPSFICNLELEFPCVSGNFHRCIPRHWVQNGVEDCAAGEDETASYSNCFPSREFGCLDGTRCLPKKYLCDGKQHCRDGSDEVELCSLPTMYRIGGNSPVLIPWSFLLYKHTAANVNITYGLDFQQAGRDLSFGFKCNVEGQLRTVPQVYIINRLHVCSSMEDKCFSEKNDFLCARCLDGTIISQQQLCNGVLDCRDLSDECSCQKTPLAELCAMVYPPKEQQQKRLSLDKVCNEAVDAEWSVDENYCSLITRNFPRVDNFTRKVIPCYHEHRSLSWRESEASYCDGSAGCPRHEDECLPECIAYKLRSVTLRNSVQNCFPFLSINKDTISFTMAVNEEGQKQLVQDSYENNSCLYNVTLHSLPDLLVQQLGIRTSTRQGDKCPLSSPLPSVIEYESLSEFLCQLNGVNCPWLHQCGVSYSSTATQIPIHKVCDHQNDCPDLSDEMNCSSQTHFYCRNRRPMYIPRHKVLDGRSDCSDRSDECFETVFSYQNLMINNRFLRYCIWIMAVCVIIFNCLAIHKQFGKLYRTKKLKFQATLLINLALADGCSGVVLLVIAIKSVQFSTNYCTYALVWLPSLSCTIIGVLTVTAFQASINILILVSAWKLFVTYRTGQNKLISTLTFSFALLCCWLFALGIAITPTLDSRFSPFVLIRRNLFFDDLVVRKLDINLYVSRTMQIASASNSTFLKDQNEDAFKSWYFDTKKGVTDFPQRNVEIVSSFGYYSPSPLCFPSFYSLYSTASVYSLVIIIYNGSALLLLCVGCFIFLQRKSPSENDLVPSDGGREPVVTRLFYTAIINLFCWLPIIGMVIASHSGYILPYIVYAISAIVLLPLKSLSNPILLSRLIPKWGRDEERRRLTENAHELDVISPASTPNEQ